jgi:hypothetical protein
LRTPRKRDTQTILGAPKGRLSRTQIDQLLSEEDNVTHSSLLRAVAILGRRVTIELV